MKVAYPEYQSHPNEISRNAGRLAWGGRSRKTTFTRKGYIGIWGYWEGNDLITFLFIISFVLVYYPFLSFSLSLFLMVIIYPFAYINILFTISFILLSNISSIHYEPICYKYILILSSSLYYIPYKNNILIKSNPY